MTPGRAVPVFTVSFLGVIGFGLIAAGAVLALRAEGRAPAATSAPKVAATFESIARPPVLAAVAPPATADGIGMVDPTQGLWHLRTRQGDPTVFYYGNPGDYPMVGDWNCDGVDTPGLYRQSDGFVYLRNSNSQGIADIRFFFGNPGDVPLAGDFDGDGCDTVSIYRPAEGRVFIINELGADEGGLGAADFSYYFGNPGDKPFVGDFNGNGEETIGLHRESTGLVYFRNSHTQGVADSQFFFGDPGDRLIAGDWTGNDVDSPGLFRPGDLTVYLRYTNTQGNADESYTWGSSAWIPVAGSFGSLTSGVTVNVSGAGEGLSHALESFYLELPSAPHLRPQHRSHLSGLSEGPKAMSVTGTATTAEAYGDQVAVVRAGSDTILAVSSDGWQWRVVGSHLASQSRGRWYGGDVRHVAMIGADWDGNPEKSNADSVHIYSVDPGRGVGAIAGIPRDTVMQAPYGQDKIAITMRGRGPAVTTETLRTATGLPLEGYFHIVMRASSTHPPGFLELVDAYGGYPFLVLYDAPPAVEGDTFVDGAEALAFARERMTLPRGDVDRSLAQGLLMKAAIAEIKPLGIGAVPMLLSVMDDFVATDLAIDDVLTFAASVYTVDPGPMPTLTPANLANLGTAAYNLNPGSIPNVVVKGCTGPFGGFFALFLTPGNLGTFADMADGDLDTYPVFGYTANGGAC